MDVLSILSHLCHPTSCMNQRCLVEWLLLKLTDYERSEALEQARETVAAPSQVVLKARLEEALINLV